MPLLGRAIRFPLRLIPRGAVLRVLSGPLRGRRWIAGAATHGCWLGTYERSVQRLFVEHVRPGGVVYDVGANAGFFTLLAAKLAGPSGAVYAFEPMERNLRYVREHLRLNRVENVHVLPVAVSDRTGPVRFAAAHNPAMGGLAANGEIEVQSTTLDALAPTIEPPSFVKMDIEGAEHAALSGAMELLRRARPVILLSEHGWEQHERCGRLLESLGYDLKLLVDGGSDGNYVVLATPR
ncbi:MAG TPA: FkbM family methyltransferase [Thermoanaerobaculia bacterium]|nr:FkbM family methyltransferase [Thermoanaerobaculia bacterium]